MSRANDSDLISIIKKLSDGEDIVSGIYVTNQTDDNMEQLATYISYSASVLYNISARTADEENIDLVVSYSSLVDKFLNESLEVLALSHQRDNSSSKYKFKMYFRVSSSLRLASTLPLLLKFLLG